MADDLDKDIYEGLIDLGVLLWVKDGELRMKYPDEISGNKKELYKFIMDHSEGLKRIVALKEGNRARWKRTRFSVD